MNTYCNLTKQQLLWMSQQNRTTPEVREAASSVISFLRRCSERFEKSFSNLLFNHPLVGIIKWQKHEKSEHRFFQAKWQWVGTAFCECRMFRVCLVFISGDHRHRERLDLRKGLFSLFLSFFFFHCGLSCYLCSRLVIWEACPCLTFEKFTVLFPPCHYLAPWSQLPHRPLSLEVRWAELGHVPHKNVVVLQGRHLIL